MKLGAMPVGGVTAGEPSLPALPGVGPAWK